MATKTDAKVEVHVPQAGVTLWRIVHMDHYSRFSWINYKGREIYVRNHPETKRLEVPGWPKDLPFPKQENPPKNA